jgi:hypothetical protein
MTAGERVSSGASMFARYAYPPNALGYCGPDDASVLFGRDDGGNDEQIAQQIAQHARQFEGAWVYLELIAAAAEIEDPLDARVVEAYWIGNELLDRLDPHGLMSQLRERFPAQAGATWMPGQAHHSYHVFAVYPWVGLLSRGVGNGAALNVLEQCRIRWGEVVALVGERAWVRSRPLVQRNGLLELGPEREETAAWSVDGRSLLSPSADGTGRPRIAVGDQVTLHWDWVCDVVEPSQLAELEARSAEQLARTNEALRAMPG